LFGFGGQSVGEFLFGGGIPGDGGRCFRAVEVGGGVG
jgi:hypothetical protein